MTMRALRHDGSLGSYQIIREYGKGKITVLNDGLGVVLEIQGADNALKYTNVLNARAQAGVKYIIRKVK